MAMTVSDASMSEEYVPNSRTEAIIPEAEPAFTPKSQMLRLAAPDPATIDPRENGTLLDALPYVDQEFNDAGAAALVERLVAEEMGNSTKSPEEYLDEKGLAKPELKFLDSEMCRTELDRIARGQAQKPVDMSRYRVEPPAEGRRGELAAWREAVDNAHAQVQNTRTRVVNLELMSKFGPNAWRVHAENVNQLRQGFAEQAEDTQQNIENLNRKRKASQMKAGDKLRNLEAKWAGSVSKTNELEGVCFLLDKEVKKLKKRAEKRGIALPSSMDTSN